MAVVENFKADNYNAKKLVTMSFDVDLPIGASGDVIKFGHLAGSLAPMEAKIYVTGATGLTSADLGFYKVEDKDGTQVWDIDAFDAGLNLSATADLEGFSAITTAKRMQDIQTLCAADKSVSDFVLAFTYGAAASAAGSAKVVMTFTQA